MRDKPSAAGKDSEKERRTEKETVMESGKQSCFPDITFRRVKMMESPMTTEELFEKINSILIEKGKIPDILDYSLATGNPIPIRTYEFDLRNSLNYGGNEGIYLSLWIEYRVEDEKRRAAVGTYKTLYEDDNAMHIMASLLADFIIEEHSYVNKNLDDFTWEGADVHALKENGERVNWGYTCGTMEAALKKKDELLKHHQQVVVRDNATRKEKIYESRT